MKRNPTGTSVCFLLLTLLLGVDHLRADPDSPEPKKLLFPINNSAAAENIVTNLTSFFSGVQLADVAQMVATNGVECWVNVSSRVPIRGGEALLKLPVCWLYVINHTTNQMGCLRMPASTLCRIALLDKQGNQVAKEQLGKMFGQPLTPKQIDDWRLGEINKTRLDQRDRRQMLYIPILPCLFPYSAEEGTPSEICPISFKDAFEITEAGEYELHVQLRLIQVGKDSSGRFHYPVTWLPEVVAKIQIRPQDIPVRDAPLGQTNSPAK